MTIKRILIAYFTFTLWLMVFHDSTGQDPLATVGYGKSCANGTNDTCDSAKYFTCNARDVCECEKEMYYESLSLQCVSVEGGNCSNIVNDTKYCIINSFCDNSSSKCVCEDKFVPAKNGQCLLSYNEGCQATEDCSDLVFLTCKRGRCDCHNDMTQVWSLTEKQCQILLNEPCRNSSGPKCVTNAKCDENSTCVCDDGFVPDSDRCAVAYNGTCTEDEDCTSSGFFICNNSTSSCGCDSTQIYNGEMCLVKVEESCAINPHCVKGASCDNEEKCRCNSHYLPNPADNTTCSPIYGGDCDIETAVDACGTFPEFSLQCSPEQNKCMCKPLYEYSNEDGKCHGSLKANCTVGVSLCVDYAQCYNEQRMCFPNGSNPINSGAGIILLAFICNLLSKW